MQNAKIIKETIIEVITNLEAQRAHIRHRIDEVEMHIKANKKAGNTAALDHLSPEEKENVQALIKTHITENNEDISSPYPQTTAKKLMPKMKEKV